ncbi:MAG: RHS repeat-associated core domain-containing protein [Chloroflexi bacterium]|nr:RHS repeat-associated core domain-containing protein [Chloroflexota bacterium]
MTNRAGQTLTWDIENRLTAVTGGVSYVYDGDGFRVKKTEGGQTVLYAGKYYEKNLSTGTVTLYYYLGDKLVAYKEIPQQGSSTLRYIHQDHLTGTSLTTDSSGNSAGSIKYKPYGETRSSTSPLPAHKFTGQRLDDIGLYYYGARYYDPQLSRFVSLDPIMSKLKNPQGQNRYSYVANNPLKNIDPNGLDWIIVGGQNSTPDDYKFWYDHLKANDLLKPGEKVYFLPDTNPGLLVFTNVNVNPRFMDLIGLLYSPNDYTDIKIMGHSEGAATVGTLMAELADNPNILPESVRNQLRAVFLLETPTGLANLGVRNFNFFELSDLPRRLGNVRGGIIIADIYNSASKVHDMMIPGWEGNTYDVATLYQKMLAMYLSGNWGLFSLALTAIEHDAIKADAMKVIQNLLGTSGE